MRHEPRQFLLRDGVHLNARGMARYMEEVRRCTVHAVPNSERHLSSIPVPVKGRGPPQRQGDDPVHGGSPALYGARRT